MRPKGPAHAPRGLLSCSVDSIGRNPHNDLPMTAGFPLLRTRSHRSSLAIFLALAGAAHAQDTKPDDPPAPTPAEKTEQPPALAPQTAEPKAGAQPNTEPPPDADQPATPETPPDAADAEPATEELETVLILKDGRRLTGTLVSKDDQRVILRVNGIPTPFGTDVVDRVESLPPIAERYRSMRATIRDGDTPRLLMLAQWLVAYQRYELASTELKAILKTDPTNKDAAQLLTVCTEQLDLNRKSKLAPKKPASKASEPTTAEAKARAEKVRAAVAERHAFPVLSPSDINVMRVYELDLRDPPRLVVPREAVEKMIESYATDPLIPQTRDGREALFRKPAAELVELIFNLRARELYPLVQVLDHPRSIKRFRDDVHTTWLINACATSQCHGGSDAGRLALASDRPNSDATVYTNLLIIDRYRTDDGKALIDFDNPARSPLLQAALPRDLSLRPHPKVETPGRGWKPIFNSQDDRRFQDAMRWIQSMYLPRPEYPIDYKPRKPLTPEAEKEPGNSGPAR